MMATRIENRGNVETVCLRLGDLSVIWVASPFGYNCPFMLLVWMIIGRMVMMMRMIKGRVMMLLTVTRDLNDGMELVGQHVVC